MTSSAFGLGAPADPSPRDFGTGPTRERKVSARFRPCPIFRPDCLQLGATRAGQKEFWSLILKCRSRSADRIFRPHCGSFFPAKEPLEGGQQIVGECIKRDVRTRSAAFATTKSFRFVECFPQAHTMFFGAHLVARPKPRFALRMLVCRARWRCITAVAPESCALQFASWR